MAIAPPAICSLYGIHCAYPSGIRRQNNSQVCQEASIQVAATFVCRRNEVAQ